MDRWEFEDICIKSRLRPVFRHNAENSVVLIADGWFSEHPERPYPHFRTVWAIGKSEGELLVGRDLYFEGLENSIPLQERISAACEDALTAVVGSEAARKMIAEHMNPERLYHA